MDTKSDILAGDPGGATGAARPVLYIAFHGYAPMTPPSRHVLGDCDLVHFGRGDASVARDRKDGLRRLVIRVPDPLMSTNHASLVHARGAWVIDDPGSKNGVFVGGARTRSSPLGFDQVFSLGHTLFFLARESVARDLAPDVAAGELPAPLPELATFDPALAAAIDRMARVAPTGLPILLLGETGTGKEVTARAIHELSGRRGPFVAVNCGGLAPTLVESELFGHRKGAFSGAVADRPGYLRSADRGTLFLDEIGELPLAAQAALLRALQEREVVPVGDSIPVPVDLRVCAATHRDLAAMVAEGTFREDLYARILGVTVTLPPLRARRVDLGLLIPTLLRRQPRADRVRISAPAATLLFDYRWPRNIRELERALSVMTALAGSDPIAVEHLPDEIRVPAPASTPAAAVTAAAEPSSGPVPPASTPAPPPAALAALTPEEAALKQQLEALLHEHDGNLAEVARQLGKDRTQVYRWVRRFGIQREGAS